MDIQDYDALVATVRRRLPELTPAQLTDLGIAVRAEQERRQWPLTSATPLQSWVSHCICPYHFICFYFRMYFTVRQNVCLPSGSRTVRVPSIGQ